MDQAGYAVLKAPDIPRVLEETSINSNPQEESSLISESYQNELSDALMRSIERYFLRNPPLARNRNTWWEFRASGTESLKIKRWEF